MGMNTVIVFTELVFCQCVDVQVSTFAVHAAFPMILIIVFYYLLLDKFVENYFGTSPVPLTTTFKIF